MPIAARNIVPGNPSFSNPPITPVNNSVVFRGDGIGAATDPFVMDVGTDTAYAVAAITTKVTGAPAISVSLQGSMDGSTWNTLTTSTSNTGETLYTPTNAITQFSTLRVFVNSTSGGTAPTLAVWVTCFNGPQTGSLAGTQNVSGTVTSNQGTPNTAANGWPVKVTDGTNTASVGNNFGGNVGALRVQAVTAAGAALLEQATPGFVRVSDGTNFSTLTIPAGGGVTGNALSVATGTTTPGTSLTAATAVANGTTIDFGAAMRDIAFQVTANGTITAGQVTLQVSVDGVTFTAPPAASLTNNSAATLANPYVLATGVTLLATLKDCGCRYARVNVSTTVTGAGGSVTALISAA